METDYTSTPYIITNIIAIFTAIISMIRPNIGRVLLSGIFIGAAAFNGFTAWKNPDLYLLFGELTTSGLYRSIILGPFSRHIELYISILVCYQVLVGAFLLYNGKLMKAAMLAGTIFLLGIAPLGIGSAFPAPLILATSLIILIRRKIEYSIYEGMGRKIKHFPH
ncbi:hypothetical protein [Ohtaekwangia koreensis]|uniref:DoxX-like family protein n=1 Tax=Ohtaekwangia koreensis TaxID=688867 RepID=A0A1T5M5R3_9BACT|nr:hypothetical protein [Ohtaekwangia koreensis]SKC83571.1 hypothetical protein SAMN05660236_4487 [Ohtaekwangia koreensis]